MVRFAIADTGIGMTEEQLNRLFLPFTQANTSTMKSYGGTGLGLAITRHFCQLLGGEISATSQRSVGSTFVIALPDSVHAPAHIEPINPRADTEAVNDITVLVVDDDPQARDLLAAKLRGQNYRLIHASNGEEALELARKIRPDAITLDVLMPRSDGWAVLSSLKADKELRDIPVVMVTVVQDRGRGLSLGAVDVLTKPVDRSELIALLRRLVLREGPVLVVEDDTSTRAMIRHVVEKLGFAVVEAENGQSALDWLAENPDPAVILLDLIMPEMDGFEFLERLKDQGDENAIPVVVLTGLQITTEERDRLLRQVQKVVAKGLSINIDISAALRDAARRRPVHTAAIAHV
jgi:CheY-like chemotaxis protein